MKGRFPRTVAEFAEQGRRVILHCGACRGARAAPRELLAATFGVEFDLYDGLKEVRARLPCSYCGAPRPRVSFYNPDERRGPVSFEDSVTHTLEFNAFVRASADEPFREPVRGPKPRRR